MNEQTAINVPKKLIFALATFGLLIALGVFEAGLRIVGFRYHLYPEKIQFGYPRPEHFATLYQADKERLWVRQDYFKTLEEIKNKKPQLILMGDSCTEFGSYDQTLRELVAQQYPEKNIGIEKVGHGGWASYQGLKQLELDIAPIKPKVATFYFGWNDHWKGFGIEDKDIAKMNSSLYVFFEPLRVVQLGAKAYIALTRDPKQLSRRVQLEDFKNNLAAMVKISRENGILPVLLTAPSSHELGKEPKYLKGGWLDNLKELVPLHNSYVDALRQVAAEQKAPVCDLFAEFDKFSKEELQQKYFKVDGIHLTKDGYTLLGQYLLDCLKRDTPSLFE